MNPETAASLRRRIELDPDADLATLATTTDTTLAIGQDVGRLRWCNQITTSVAEDADLHTTCGALLDALAVLETTTTDEAGTLDTSTVNVLIDRLLPDGHLSETDQAVRSLREAVSGVQARVWYRRGEAGWAEDCEPAPTWGEDDPVVAGWVDDYLLPRLTTPPSGLAVEIVAAVDDPSLQLYPSAIKRGSTDTWALRVDGLQIGTAGATSATLTIGKPGKNSDGTQRRTFIEVFGQASVTVTADAESGAGEMTVATAAEGIRRLLTTFREADVRGAPLSHRAAGGVRFIDEHTLEARLLKGLARLTDSEHQLVLDDGEVARGSQFPTLWGHGAKPRYLDALLRRGTTPLAVELKVATGGQGRYYRRSLIQAALYAHLIHHAPGLEPWFHAAGLDRSATQPCIGVPIPTRWTKRFSDDLELLRRVASRVGVEVHVLDDRATPDWSVAGGLPEPDVSAYEQLSWRLASALSTRWPTSLGRVVEVHDCGGFYDQIQLQPLSDRSLDWPAARPRISLNRPGSAWVFAQTGQPRWVWREIWEHLAAGGDAGQAAATLGAIAGLGSAEAATGPRFAQLAVAFLELVDDGFSWRCAWPSENSIPAWVDRYSSALARYAEPRASDPFQPSPASGERTGTVRRPRSSIRRTCEPGSGGEVPVSSCRTMIRSTGSPRLPELRSADDGRPSPGRHTSSPHPTSDCDGSRADASVGPRVNP